MRWCKGREAEGRGRDEKTEQERWRRGGEEEMGREGVED